ncbi:MAG: glutathione S-transferase family protein [Gammaproteobacteria bacterium]|nr:glutathione S-transferase family protein [Gammaproteobacteria bacterium]
MPSAAPNSASRRTVNIKNGRFVRSETQFRNWITASGEAGRTGTGGFKAEADRYHLYVSLACPWAHRTLIFRSLKGLQDVITVSVAHWFMGDNGWSFEPGDGVVPDTINGTTYLKEIYALAQAGYTGRITVPVLWDKHRHTIVNNESSEIIRMFNSAFDGVGARPGDYYPPALRDEIDALNDRIYDTLNNGVYKCGFARTQEAYDEAVVPLFDTLEFLEERLSRQRYLTGDSVTEADWRLFTTLVRFDPVYFGHFKCNLKRIVDYPNLSGTVRDLYQQPGIAETVNMAHIKGHYYGSHESINPWRIVPLGPQLDYSLPHDRAGLGCKSDVGTPHADSDS